MSGVAGAPPQLPDTAGDWGWGVADFRRHQERVSAYRFDEAGTAPLDEDVIVAMTALRGWPTSFWPIPVPGDDPRRVAIVGKGVERYLAPWGEDGWELWGLNHADHRPPVGAYTRWFQLHPPRYLGRHSRDSLDDLQRVWTRRRDVRLYMDRAYAKYPDSEPYPKEAVEALTPHGRYHTSSFDWMVALAVHEGFDEIALYGCEFYTPPPYNGEPVSGRACLEYWCGVAEGRGITVSNATYGGDLFRTVHLARMRSRIQYGFGREPALQLGDGWRDLR